MEPSWWNTPPDNYWDDFDETDSEAIDPEDDVADVDDDPRDHEPIDDDYAEAADWEADRMTRILFGRN